MAKKKPLDQQNESSFTKNRVGRTEHGDGLIVHRSYKLKQDTGGNVHYDKKHDLFIVMPAGTVVTLLRHTETTYSCFLEASGKTFNIESDKTYRWESKLLVKYPKKI